jgi:hypothetical protein
VFLFLCSASFICVLDAFWGCQLQQVVSLMNVGFKYGSELNVFNVWDYHSVHLCCPVTLSLYLLCLYLSIAVPSDLSAPLCPSLCLSGICISLFVCLYAYLL